MSTEQTYLEIREVSGPENSWHHKQVKVGNYTGVVGRQLRRGTRYQDSKEGLKKIRKKIASEPPRQTTFKLFRVNTEKREFNTNYQNSSVNFVVEIQLRYRHHEYDSYIKVDEVHSSLENRDKAIQEAREVIEKIVKKNDFAYHAECEYRLVLRSTTVYQEEISSTSYTLDIEDVSDQL